MDAFMPLLRCPICHEGLARTDKTLRCPAGHSFDLAREGYVNLLGHGAPGDTAAQLRARRAFLGRGFYAPLAERVAGGLLAHLAAWPGGADPPAVLDAGCGEGYYLGQVAAACRAAGQPARLGGADSARDAVRLAARAVPDAAFVVADIWQRLPVADGALAGLLNLFAPRNPLEFARVLAPRGLLLVVIPGPDHLAELRAALPLLGIEADKEAKVQAAFADSFAPQPAQALTYRLALDPAALVDLVAMTPSAPHLSESDQQAVAALGAVETTASFRLLPFIRLDQTGIR